MRFSVKSCLYSFGYRKHRERIKIIVDGVRPVFEVNRYFVLEQIGRGGQTSASIYHVCIYLNYLDSFGIDYIDVKLDDIQKFLNVLYTDGLPCAGKGKPCSLTVIHDYIDAISKMYDGLVFTGYRLEDSMYTPSQLEELMAVSNGKRRKARLLKKGDHLTGVYTLKKSFAKDKAVRKDV